MCSLGNPTAIVEESYLPSVSPERIITCAGRAATEGGLQQPQLQALRDLAGRSRQCVALVPDSLMVSLSEKTPGGGGGGP